jgi:hypothetical protein
MDNIDRALIEKARQPMPCPCDDDAALELMRGTLWYQWGRLCAEASVLLDELIRCAKAACGKIKQ